MASRESGHCCGGARRQSTTGIPAMSGLLHVAICPGGQGDGAAGLSTAAAGAAAGTGGGAGVATAEAGIGGGSFSGVTTTGARAGDIVAGAGAGAPVIFGARAIGPGVDSTAAAAGGLTAGAGGGSIGAQAPSQIGIATRIATDHISQIRRAAQPGFCRGAITWSSASGIGVPPASFSPEDYAQPGARETTRECRARRRNLGQPGRIGTRLLRFARNDD